MIQKSKSNSVNSRTPSSGQDCSAEFIELENQVFEINERDFTWRSVFVGTAIGCVLAAQNVYFGLRNGMSFGDGMVSAIIGYGMMKFLLKYIPMKPFELHEHVILQTAAAANVSIIFSGGFSQYLLAMTPQVQQANDLGDPSDTWSPTYLYSVIWLLLAVFLGFFVSQPYRTKLIVEQTLPWPSPTATAIVLNALHGDNQKEGAELSQKIGISTAVSFLWQWYKWLFDGQHQMSKWPIFGSLAAKYTWYCDWSPAYIASGMLTTPKAVLSMLLGALYGFALLYPIAESMRGDKDWYPADAKGMNGAKAYWFLASLSILVTDSLYQSVKVCITTYRDLLSKKLRQKELEPPHRLVPTRFWLTAFLINALVVIIVVPLVFPAIKWYLVLPTLLVAIPVGYGVCLGGALTGTFLISAVGKIVIIVFGSFSGSIMGALWLSGIGMITVGSTEQVLVDYQVAHLTKTSPRQMFKAQLVAAFIGVFITPLSYSLFMNAFEITENGHFTAPGGVALRSLAVMVVNGFSDLPGHIEYFIAPSIVLALLMSCANDFFPEAYRRYVPNAMAFSFGFYVNASFPLNMLIGQIVKYTWDKFDPSSQHRLGPIVAGGMIAGEGLAAVSQALVSMCGIESPQSMALSFATYSN